MADKSLKRVFFPIYRETTDDAGRVVKDPIGVFSCRLSTARFFDIDKLNFNFEVQVTRKGGARSLTLADGTKLTSSTKDADKKSADSTIVLPVNSKGSRTVILTTGKKITDTKRVANKDGAYHTVSFRFPSWATVAVIADALGEIIPATKLKANPTEADASPYFRVKGGRLYTINAKAAAEAKTDATVPANKAEAETLVKKSKPDAKVTEAAG